LRLSVARQPEGRFLAYSQPAVASLSAGLKAYPCIDSASLQLSPKHPPVALPTIPVEQI